MVFQRTTLFLFVYFVIFVDKRGFEDESEFVAVCDIGVSRNPAMNDVELLTYLRTQVVPLAPLVFVLVGLSQVLVGVLSKLLQRVGLLFHPTGTLELSLNQYGATLGLLGTLQAIGKEQLIVNMAISVTALADGAQRTFEWRAFRPYLFELTGQEERTVHLEPVAAFMVSPSAPFKFNLVFVDDRFIANYGVEAENVVRAWERHGGEMAEFLQRPPLVELKERLYAEGGWRSGEYAMQLQIRTARKTFRQEYRFEIEPAQVELLKNNFEQIARFVCKQPWRFVGIRAAYAAKQKASRARAK